MVPQQRFFKHIRAILLIVALLFAGVTGCTSDDPVKTEDSTEGKSSVKLAEIGDFEISENHFRNMFSRFYERTGRMRKINPEILTSILDDEVDVYTAVTYAQNNQWHQDQQAQYRKAKIWRQALMEEYERRYVHPDVNVTEEFLEELFTRINTYLRASHIYAPDRYTADSLYQELQNGAEFEQLAADNFEDAKLAENGGDLGYFTVDEMDVGFEFKAYEMQVGEISEPVRTSRGYSIIKLTDRVTNPVMSEHEFANKKPQLRSMANEKLGEYYKRGDMYEKIRQMNMDRWVLSKLWEEVKDDIQRGVQPERPESNPFQAIDSELKDEKLVDQPLHSLSVEEFTEEAYYSEPASLRDIDSLIEFEKFAEGIAFRTYALNKILNSDNIHREYVEATVDRSFHVYLNSRLTETIRDTVHIPESVLRQEFQQNRNDYYHPAELNLAELAIDDLEKAEQVYHKITHGDLDFNEALHEYGFDEEAKVYDGELGYIPINKFGGISPALSEAEPGDVLGPFEMRDDVVFIFKTLGRREAEPMNFDEAKSQIEQRFKEDVVQRERNRILRETRWQVGADVNYAKLREIDLSNN